MVILVLGGARSGKSACAEQIARSAGEPVCYVATALVQDDEMAARVAAHRGRRPPDWATVEVEIDLLAALDATDCPTVLVDSLTVWAGSLVVRAGAAPDPAALRRIEAAACDQVDAIAGAADGSGRTLILVSDEVGSGIVPPYPLGRAFRDLLGAINQRAAARADHVLLVVAGIPVDLRAIAWR